MRAKTLLAVLVLAVAGCGRLGYDPVTGEIAGDGGRAVAGDAATGSPDAPSSSPDAAQERWFPGFPCGGGLPGLCGGGGGGRHPRSASFGGGGFPSGVRPPPR